jgi:ABC-type phosphate transport system substrate-binding protein/serine/threonine protein kinase
MEIIDNLYPEYPCSRNSPLNCDRPSETAQEIKGAKFCLDCGFPAILPLPSEIGGQRGNYQVTSYLGVRGIGRLYSGTRLQDGQPVEIVEYLLPDRCFSAEESQQIKATFQKVAGVSLADGRIQNFRLVQTWEAIADTTAARCYLIRHSIPGAKTLSQYLRETPAINSERVREVLNQTLQTLEFLHTQKLRLPNNQVRPGSAHGNLSLDSILIEVKSDREFYIYLADLALWAHLFIPSHISRALPDPRQDLRSLGTIAACLWSGKTNLTSKGEPLDLSENQQWMHSDPPLREFLRHLTGIETPFESAQAARLALLQLPKLELGSSVNSDGTLAETVSRRQTWGVFMAISGLLLFGATIIWYLLPRTAPQPAGEFRLWYSLLSGFADVNGVPTGEFTYTGERDGTWTNVLGLTPQSDRTFQELLTKPKPDLAATFTYQPIASPNLDSGSKPITAVIAGKNNFAITSLTTGMTDELDRQQIGYDGLLVFVAFSKKASSLPKALKGQITVEQLRQIYTGKLTNWQQLGGINLPIKPYVPTEIEALRLFKKLILKDDPEDIILFDARVTRMATEKTQQLILKEFDEERTGIVSFGTLSRTWNQCSGYPLAIVNSEKPPIQVLFRQDGKPIDPSVNLCDKNNYLDVTSFQADRYPLGYPVFVVYPRNNSLPPAGAKFAELLITRQGQCLLSKVGLVPRQPLPDKYLKSNVCKSMP